MKTRFAIILTLLATIIATSFAQGRGPKRNDYRDRAYSKEWNGRHDRDLSSFERSLNYHQKVTIDQIRYRAEKASNPLRAKLRKLEDQHHKLIHKNKPNLKKINDTIRQIEKTRAQLARIDAQARHDILSLLTNHQKRLFNEYEKMHKRSFLRYPA